MSDRAIREMQAQIADLQRQVRARPVVVSGTRPNIVYPVLRVLGGNSLGSLNGVKKSSTLVDLSAVTHDPGYQAVAGAVTISAGAITAVAAPTGLGVGSVYSTAAVTVTGDGSGAVITATVSSGAVTGFTVVNGGSGYTTATITISSPNGTPSGLPWADGIGYGDLTTDGVTFERVLIVHDTRSPIEYALAESFAVISPVTVYTTSRTVNSISTTTKVRTAMWS